MSERRVLVNENSLIAIGSAIREKNGTDTSYKPGDMAAAILEIETGIEPVGDITITENGEYDVVNYAKAIVEVAGSGGGDIEIPVFSGDCKYRFAYDGWNWFIEAFGNKIRTENITNAQYMFSDSSDLKEIPFEINYDNSLSSMAGQYMFSGCQSLKEIPTMNNFSPSNLQYVFDDCHSIRYLPEDMLATWRWEYFHTHTCSSQYMFSYCHSLRSIPSSLLKNLYSISTGAYSSIYKSLFNYCSCLDEVCGLKVQPVVLTSNHFTSCFHVNTRLKNMTFETNADGTPIIAQWKSQTINLNTNIGYATGFRNNILNYNSGITTDTEITDDATYQALKDNPDSWTENINYSRYNHDSAVATINSLPDTSAYLATAGGTNTIKFTGDAGALTDAGAINTMTEEEIAVAAAKGWTVSLV